MFERFAKVILILKWPILLAAILLTFVFGRAMIQLQIDPSMETLFVKDSPEFLYYQDYREKYGSDQMIAVAMDTADLFNLRHLWMIKTLTDEISRFKQVERVMSLANAMDIKHKFAGVKIVPALAGVFEGERPLEDLKKDILSNELYLNNLVSRDGKVANILIYLKPSVKDPHAVGVFIEKLRTSLSRLERPGLKFYMAGSPIEQYDFIRLIRRDQFTFVPLITLLLILTTFLIYRSIACVVLAMSIVFCTLAWTMGTISLLGQALNLMTSLLAPVVMIVSVINSIYLMNLFFEIRPHHPSLRKAVVMTIDQLGIPCLLTHLIAVLGFASLALNRIPAIQSFGLFAALGTLYSYFAEIILTTILLPILPYRKSGPSLHDRHILNRMIVNFLEKLDFRWKWWILGLTGVVVLSSIYGMKKIEIDTNIVKQMKPNLPLAISTRFIDERLTGVYSLGFVMKRKNGESFVDPETLRCVDAFKAFLESHPGIPKVNCVTTVVKKIHEAAEGNKEAYKIPDDLNRLQKYFQGMKEAGDPELLKLISSDFMEIRLDARMKAVGTREGAAIEASARQYLQRNLGQYFDYELTGNVVLLGKMAKGLVHEQMQSFSFAAASIFTVIVLVFRSLVIGLLAAIPNLVPILAVYGLMGFSGIELSTPTAMISSIVLGLVVDASIQFLYRFRREFRRRHHYLQSLHHTYRNMGQSMVVSTMILVAGFGSSVCASFRPTVHFGVLTSLTIFFALICTLVILPVTLIIVKPFGRQRLFKKDGVGGFREIVRIEEG